MSRSKKVFGMVLSNSGEQNDEGIKARLDQVRVPSLLLWQTGQPLSKRARTIAVLLSRQRHDHNKPMVENLQSDLATNPRPPAESRADVGMVWEQLALSGAPCMYDMPAQEEQQERLGSLDQRKGADKTRLLP